MTIHVRAYWICDECDVWDTAESYDAATGKALLHAELHAGPDGKINVTTKQTTTTRV
jgi:hypothetical protein